MLNSRFKNLHVLCLKPLRAFHDIKLHRLTFLQATEAVAANGRVMHKNVLAYPS
jgi:hypothetical protein